MRESFPHVLIGGPHEGVLNLLKPAYARMRFGDGAEYKLEYGTGKIRQYRFAGMAEPGLEAGVSDLGMPDSVAVSAPDVALGDLGPGGGDPGLVNERGDSVDLLAPYVVEVKRSGMCVISAIRTALLEFVRSNRLFQSSTASGALSHGSQGPGADTFVAPTSRSVAGDSAVGRGDEGHTPAHDSTVSEAPEQGNRRAPLFGQVKPLEMRDFGGVPTMTPSSLEEGSGQCGHPLESLHPLGSIEAIREAVARYHERTRRRIEELSTSNDEFEAGQESGLREALDDFPIVVSAEAGAEIRKTEGLEGKRRSDANVTYTSPVTTHDDAITEIERLLAVPSIGTFHTSELRRIAADAFSGGAADHCVYCGFLAWTIEKHGRVTHKHACPHRTDAFCQTHPKGCPTVSGGGAVGAESIGTFHTSELESLAQLAEDWYRNTAPRSKLEAFARAGVITTLVAIVGRAREATSDGEDTLWSLEPRKSERED